jgi:hypothetical protein
MRSSDGDRGLTCDLSYGTDVNILNQAARYLHYHGTCSGGKPMKLASGLAR